MIEIQSVEEIKAEIRLLTNHYAEYDRPPTEREYACIRQVAKLVTQHETKH